MAGPSESIFGLLGLDDEVILAVKELPTQRTKGLCLLIPIDYVQLALWMGPVAERDGGACIRKLGKTFHKFYGGFQWEGSFVHVYTDGSCHNQQYPWLRRSGAGVYWGPEHP